MSVQSFPQFLFSAIPLFPFPENELKNQGTFCELEQKTSYSGTRISSNSLLIDTSGSMEGDKLAEVKALTKSFIDKPSGEKH